MSTPPETAKTHHAEDGGRVHNEAMNHPLRPVVAKVRQQVLDDHDWGIVLHSVTVVIVEYRDLILLPIGPSFGACQGPFHHVNIALDEVILLPLHIVGWEDLQ